jgi:sterol desaturase/sphingolipid hydroxylase (fatty acid hydroxylase superfamily)
MMQFRKSIMQSLGLLLFFFGVQGFCLLLIFFFEYFNNFNLILLRVYVLSLIREIRIINMFYHSQFLIITIYFFNIILIPCTYYSSMTTYSSLVKCFKIVKFDHYQVFVFVFVFFFFFFFIFIKL